MVLLLVFMVSNAILGRHSAKASVLVFVNVITIGLVVLRIYVALVMFQPYRDLEASSENSSGETGNRAPDLLYCKLMSKPKA